MTKPITVKDVKQMGGGLFTFNGFLYLCTTSGVNFSQIFEVGSSWKKWTFFYPHLSKIDEQCEVELIFNEDLKK